MADNCARKKAAFITGITGQDGSYLTEILLEKGYEVHGLVRPSSQRRQALNHQLRPGITLHVGDVTDSGRLLQILGNIEIDELYHMAAQSHVGVSFDSPLSTCDINALGTLRLLEAVRILGLHKKIRFYSAVTSELFGNDAPAPQDENTSFHPVSPYALAKQFQYGITVNFRDAYGFHASNGILFNHESPRRGTNFVTRKITTQVALIACGKSEEFQLGNLNATRDWGHARDYMEGVWLMLQQPTGDDFVLATGQSISIRDFVQAAFKVIGEKIVWTGSGVDEIGMDEATGKVRITVNPRYYRPVENENLLGSAEKAKRVLGWEPRHTIYDLVEEMVIADIDLARRGMIFSDTLLDWLVVEPGIKDQSTGAQYTDTIDEESGGVWASTSSQKDTDSTVGDSSVAQSKASSDNGGTSTEASEYDPFNSQLTVTCDEEPPGPIIKSLECLPTDSKSPPRTFEDDRSAHIHIETRSGAKGEDVPLDVHADSILAEREREECIQVVTIV